MFEQLQHQTQNHINYLTSIGLGERAQEIAISRFSHDDLGPVGISTLYTKFDTRTEIPQEVLNFNPNAKNTLITTDPAMKGNDPVELQKILDIRLYPVLRELIQQYGVEVFLGTKHEMVSYYQYHGWNIMFEFRIPSSARYYLAYQSSNESWLIIMSGLVSRDNVIAQLLTLKLVKEINIEKVNIIGVSGAHTESPGTLGAWSKFSSMVQQEIDVLRTKIPTEGNKILIVAGCGLEARVANIVKNQYKTNLDKFREFRGDIISLIYMPFLHPVSELIGINNVDSSLITGIISLHLNYGDIMEEITYSLLKDFNCTHVFTGSACGFIPTSDYRPEIGTRISVVRSINGLGEIVDLRDESEIIIDELQPIHLQIPSIFMETYEWLEIVKQIKCSSLSVDVETFYIMRAIRNYKLQHSKHITVDCRCFVSDYVGEAPLRDYSKVFIHYETVLGQFLEKNLK
ncbi:Hypothetical protein HVR_LOCUS977 [uncultured virus]|nr:Hypothetical protein HVR_LOCUS977 [uncultured virus]